MAVYCVYWNPCREQYHVSKTETVVKYYKNYLIDGLTYDEADVIRKDMNDTYIPFLMEKLTNGDKKENVND